MLDKAQFEEMQKAGCWKTTMKTLPRGNGLLLAGGANATAMKRNCSCELVEVGCNNKS